MCSNCLKVHPFQAVWFYVKCQYPRPYVSGLQAALDRPDIFDGVMVVNPNFRELHVAESPAPAQPVVRFVQRLLREKGQVRRCKLDPNLKAPGFKGST